VLPIPGTRKRRRLRENVAAASLVLSDEETTELDQLASQVQGERA
jgi:aryl-alcohol dehydrogenase-like predicted oxidoreductase